MATSNSSGGNGSGRVVKPTDVTYRGLQAAYDVFTELSFADEGALALAAAAP